MNKIRLVDAPLKITFAAIQKDNESSFKREYDSFSESDDDPIGQWLRLASAKGETKESDQVLLTLIVELHRKIDLLNAKLSNEEIDYLNLEFDAKITSIGYENFKIEDSKFEQNINYYGRITMPVFPKRDVAIYFEAVSSDIAKIKMMHERDIKDWNSYITARERAMIREMKGL